MLSEAPTVPTHALVAWVRRLFVVSVCFAYGLAGLAVGMDSTYDLLNYHFFDPFWVFVDSMRGVAPGGSQSFINPLISTPFYFGPRYLPPLLFQFLIGSLQGIAGPILYLIARELRLTRIQSVLCALCGMFASTAISEIGNGQGDTLIAPLLLGAMLILLRVFNRPELTLRTQLRRILVAGLLTGAALGLKETVIGLAVGIGVFTLLLSKDVRAALRAGVVLSLGIGLGYLATYGWWGVILWMKFNSPVFPMYNEYIRSAWALPVKNVGWDRSLHGLIAMISYPFRILLVRNPNPVADYPYGYITGVVGFRQLGFPVLELLFGAALVVKLRDLVVTRKWRERSASHLGAWSAFFVSAYVIWCWTTGIYRYVVVMEMLSPLLIFLTIRYLLDRGRAAKFVVPIAVVVLLAVAFTQIVPDWGRTKYTSAYFSVEVPAPMNDHNAAVVIVGDSPSSFIIPYFSNNPSFIRSGQDFPLYGRMQQRALTIIKHADHVFVMWGDSHVEDTLTWGGVTSLAPYPKFLDQVKLGTTSFGCQEFNVRVNVSTTPFHYCEVR